MSQITNMNNSTEMTGTYFVNTGFVKLNFDSWSEHPFLTGCIVGFPRSGTSLVSSIVHNLGLFTGEKSRSPTYEDKLLKDALDQDDLAGFVETVRTYNEAHDKWAFKLPRATYKLPQVLPLLREPVVICTIRDPLALQMRKNMSQRQEDLFQGMQESLDAYNKLLRDLSRLSSPLILLSYDKVASNTGDLVRQLADILLPDRTIDVDKIGEKLRKDQTEYLENARYDKAWGQVEQTANHEYVGWVVVQNPKNAESLGVELLDEDGNVLLERECSRARYDLDVPNLTDASGHAIHRIIIRRNLRKFAGKLGFALIVDGDTASRVAALRVKGDRKPFWWNLPLSG